MTGSSAERRTIHNRTYYENGGKERIRSARQRHRERNRKHIEELKKAPCTDCGLQYPPYVMEFDHISDNKYKEIARLSANAASLAKIDLEISKCELVCANCHKIRTHLRRNIVL